MSSIRQGDGRKPILWIALGRQRVGKTALLNSAVQFFREAGTDIRVWNADQQNKSHTLSQFFPDAEHVPEGGVEDAKVWIEERLSDLIEHRYDAVLDVGGGATGFSNWCRRCRCWRRPRPAPCARSGCSAPVPSARTWTIWSSIAEVDMFMPAASVIVLNDGPRPVGPIGRRRLRADAAASGMSSVDSAGGRAAMFPASPAWRR